MDATHGHRSEPFLIPSQLLTLEVLRRPLDSTQFTSEGFTGLLQAHGVKISMDGRGRWMDNVFIERLWRSVKCEEVYLKGYESIPEARRELAAYFDFYNLRRRHQGLEDRTPDEVYWSTLPGEGPSRSSIAPDGPLRNFLKNPDPIC